MTEHFSGGFAAATGQLACNPWQGQDEQPLAEVFGMANVQQKVGIEQRR